MRKINFKDCYVKSLFVYAHAIKNVQIELGKIEKWLYNESGRGATRRRTVQTLNMSLMNLLERGTGQTWPYVWSERG